MMLRKRDFAGIILALVADGVQVSSAVVSFGSAELAVPLQLLFSASVSVLLMLVMGPSVRLLPSSVVELVPMVNVAPGFTLGALWVAFHNRRRVSRKGLSNGK